MFRAYRALRRAIRHFAIVTGATVAAPVVLMVMPKDMAYGATTRFLMVIVTGVTVVAGAYAVGRAWRRLTEARLKLRFANSPKQVAVTLRFMLDEARLARRYMMPAFLTVLASVSLWLLAHWPQFGPSAMWRQSFVVIGAGALLILVLAPIFHRTHWINERHCRALIAQQVRFSDFIPVTMRMARQHLRALLGPAVFKSGGRVFAGGFPWEWDDFTKGLVVAGQPGAGKTVTVLNALLESFFLMFEGKAGFSALILDVKGDFRGKIEGLCEKYGRSDDLVIFDLLGDPAAAGAMNCAIFNPVDSPDPAAEVAASLQEASKQLGVAYTDSFFPDSFRSMNIHGLVLLRAGLPEGSVPSVADLKRLFTELHAFAGPAGPPADAEPQGLYAELCERIRERWPTPQELPEELLQAVLYINAEFLPMPNKQRGGLISTASQFFTEMLAEPLRHFTTGKSTIAMRDVLEQGRIYYVHAPLAETNRLGIIANTLIKRQFQTAVRRSRGKPIPSIFLVDEYHNLFSPGRTGDSQFFSLSRESNHANLIAFQNLDLLHQGATKADVMSLLGNCATKLFLRNTHPGTNEFASSLFGDVSGIGITQSEAADVTGLSRRTHSNFSRAAANSRLVPPSAFTKLAVPVKGDPDQQYSESIVHLATRAEIERLDLTWKVHPL